MKLTKEDEKAWKKMEGMLIKIEESYTENPEDERCWEKNTDKLLKPSKKFERGEVCTGFKNPNFYKNNIVD